MALTDFSMDQGCLRMLEGSHSDGRLEAIAAHIQDNKIAFLIEQPRKTVLKVIKTIFYTTGVFEKTQMLLEMALDLIPDMFDGKEVTTIEMKAGEAIIFCDLNLHGSYPNITDDERIAYSGRYTSNDVQFYKDTEFDSFPTPSGRVRFKVDKMKCIQVHGEDKFGHNRIATAPKDAVAKRDAVPAN